MTPDRDGLGGRAGAGLDAGDRDAGLDDAGLDDAGLDASGDFDAGEELDAGDVLDAGDELDVGDELVWELDGWDAHERIALSARLHAAGVAHEWDGDDLVASADDEQAVEDALDGEEFPDVLEPVDDVGDDERTYALTSALFVAADRAAGGDAGAGEVQSAAAGIAGVEAPYGVADRDWAQVQQLAEQLSGEAQAGEGTAVRATAARLRDLLRTLV